MKCFGSKKHVVNTEDLAMLEFIYHTGWNVIARHYHQPTAQWAGPHGKAYSVLLGSSIYNWLYTGSGGIVHPDTPTEFHKDQNPILKHQIPTDLILYFTQPKLPRMEIDTFIRGGQKIELNPLVSYQERLALTNLLNGTDSLDFQKAVHSVENAYYDGNLNQQIFYDQIEHYANFCRGIMRSGDILYEGKGDEQAAKAQCAVFVFMTDSVPMQFGDTVLWRLPFEYNFDDYAGRKNWNSMFVSTLVQTGKGNYHSLPILYKMIMDRLGEKCWLSLAPNHMYIKAWNTRGGWYNIELTCGDFPSDAWLTTSGYIHLDAIRSGIYMDTLSVRQSCLTDLAQGYLHKYGVGDGKFIIGCCDTTLRYYPNYINALLLKAKTMTHCYTRQNDKTSPYAKALKEDMDKIHTLIHELGYRKMPKEMYLSWLYSLNKYSDEYRVKKITTYMRK